MTLKMPYLNSDASLLDPDLL